MSAIAERRIFRVLAHAEVRFLRLVNREGKRREPRASMRAVAEWLSLGLSTGTPMVFTFL